MAKTNRDVTVYGRLSFEHLFTPHAVNENADPKYSMTLLIPKTDTKTVEALNTAINNAVQDGVERHVFKQAIDPAQTKYPPLRGGGKPTTRGGRGGPGGAGVPRPPGGICLFYTSDGADE